MRRKLVLLAALTASCFAAAVGPSRGTLMIVGGGTLGPELVDKFFELAGGKDAPIVVIPTADGAEEYRPDYLQKTFLSKAGATHLTLLHTKNRAVADSKEFIAPLRKAKAVWFVGGRQWRLVDSYLDTRTEHELFALLKRGGVIGGSSAGATIQGSYLVRGAREGNELMMAPGYERGMGFLRNTAIDQHILTRKRERDMAAVVKAHPELLGIGIDEGTAILVHGNSFSVLGKSKVAITLAGQEMYFLKSGDAFDLSKRKPRSEPLSLRAAITERASEVLGDSRSLRFLSKPKGLRRMSEAALVHFAPMSDPRHLTRSLSIINLVHRPVLTDSNSPLLVFAFSFLQPVGRGVAV